VKQSFASLISFILYLSQILPNTNVNQAKEVMLNGSLLSPQELISLLPRLYLKISSKDGRVTVFQAFALVFRNLGLTFRETNFHLIAKNCLEFLAHPKLESFKPELLSARKAVEFLMHEVVGKDQSESGQLSALRELLNCIKDTSNLQEASLCCALGSICSLVYELGPAAQPAQDEILEPLMALLEHPSPSVKIALASCVQSICLALPQTLNNVVTKVVSCLQKDIKSIASAKPELMDKLLGYGQVLSAVVRTIPLRSLFASYDDAATIFTLSTQLLRTHMATKNFRVMSCQAQVAWTLIGSLMSLGPKFVKVHISQLLLIWKGTFPKIQPKDWTNVGDMEWGYHVFAKDAAVAALYSFLFFNATELVTPDVFKRVIVCLNNANQFLSVLNSAYKGVTEQFPPSGFHCKLYERECHLRKRVFACFTELGSPLTSEGISQGLIKSAIEVFAPDGARVDKFPFIGKDGCLQIESVYPTSLANGMEFNVGLRYNAEERHVSKLLGAPLVESEYFEMAFGNNGFRIIDNDPHHLYMGNVHMQEAEKDAHFSEGLSANLMPVNSTVGVVDAAIELFVLFFSHQTPSTQDSLLEQLIESANMETPKITPIRKSATQLNALVAIIGVLKYSMGKKELLAGGSVYSAIRDLAKGFITSSDETLRSAASEILGRVCRVYNTAAFVSPIIEYLIDTVVNQRDPDSRAGAALAIGSIYSYVGGIAGSSHLKTVVSVLHSLAADPHPLVHNWSLHALSLTIESAGLMYGPFVKSSLSLITQLYMSDTHEICAASANGREEDSNVHVYPLFGRILYALISVLGPELQDTSRVRDTCFAIYHRLKNEANASVVIEAIRCNQNFIMFAPKHVGIKLLVPFLLEQLSENPKLKLSMMRKASVTCLYQLAQRDAGAVLKAANSKQIEEQLFGILDIELDPMVRGEIKDTLITMLRFLAPKSPSRWIDICKNILIRAAAAPTGKSDEERDAEEMGTEEKRMKEVSKASPSVTLLPRWRTQVFATKCLSMVIDVVAETKIQEHTDLKLARRKRDQDEKCDLLVFKIADLIKLAFNSCTANVADLRIAGLQLLKNILQVFGPMVDPDFEEHRLLEQYEAQIISALAPAFTLESHPLVTHSACDVCAFFISSGISHDVNTMVRPFKLLVTILEEFSSTWF
jgi:hypothetical protein